MIDLSPFCELGGIRLVKPFVALLRCARFRFDCEEVVELAFMFGRERGQPFQLLALAAGFRLRPQQVFQFSFMLGRDFGQLFQLRALGAVLGLRGERVWNGLAEDLLREEPGGGGRRCARCFGSSGLVAEVATHDTSLWVQQKRARRRRALLKRKPATGSLDTRCRGLLDSGRVLRIPRSLVVTVLK